MSMEEKSALRHTLRKYQPLLRIIVVLSASFLIIFLGSMESFFLAKQVKDHLATSNQILELQSKLHVLSRNISEHASSKTVNLTVSQIDGLLAGPRLSEINSQHSDYPPARVLQHITFSWQTRVRLLVSNLAQGTQLKPVPVEARKMPMVDSYADAAINEMLDQTHELLQALEQSAQKWQSTLMLLQLASWALAIIGIILAIFYTREAFIRRMLIIHGYHSDSAELERGEYSAFNSERQFVEIIDSVDQILANSQIGEALLVKVLKELEGVPGVAAASIEFAEDLAASWGIAPSINTGKAELKHLRTTFIDLLAAGGHSVATYDLLLSHTDSDSARQVLALTTPINDRSRSFGLLVLEAAPKLQFQPWKIQLARVVGRQIAAAIGSVSVARESRRITLMEERTAIARELHDSIAQSLAFMKIQITRLQTLIEIHRIPEDINLVVNDLSEGLNNGYRKLRELLTTFRVNVAAAGLSASLEEAIEELRGHSGLTLTLDNRLRDCKLTANEEIHILQIVREALSNVVRHAQATNVLVALEYDLRFVTVVIEDNGIGLGNPTNPRFHHGAVIMKERANSLGGELDIGSREQGGTRIKFRFVPTSVKNRDKFLIEV